MKIIILGSYLFPTGIATSARIRNLARGFKEANAEVYIIAGSPPFNDHNYSIGEWFDYEEGIKLYFTSDNKSSFKSIKLRKRLIFLDCVRKASNVVKQLIKQDKIDAIFLYEHSYLNYSKIIQTAKKQSIPTILDIVEIPIMKLKFSDLFTHPFQIDAYFSHKKLTPKIDIHSSITTYLQKLYDHTPSIKYLLPSIEAWDAPSNKPFDNSEVFTFAYVGALLEKDAPDRLFEFIDSLIDRKIDFKIKIIGRYESTAEGKSWMNKFKAEKRMNDFIVWLGETSDDELMNNLISSDGLILLRQNRIIEEYSFPTRLVEYLKTGNPVFITNKGDIPVYLEHMKNACFINSFDVSKTIDDVIEIIKNRSLAKEIGTNGYQTGRKVFNRKNHAQELINIIEQLNKNELAPAHAHSSLT